MTHHQDADAISLLTEDHRTVEQLFADYERGLRGPDAKRQAVDQIVRELSVHVAIEEAYFYFEGLTVQMNATGCPAWNSVS
jgi:hemerythrin superfamily protein